MDDFDHLWQSGVALAIGLLLEIERGWHRRETPDAPHYARAGYG